MDHSQTPIIPDWAADAVWYQIFPDRFRCGAPQSNPLAEEVDGAPDGWQVCPWGMDWHDRADWEQGTDSFYDTVYTRHFGGDLVGIREKLPYLQDLGINAIYLNPVFDAPSPHKYDGSTFHHVDPSLGPDRAGDRALLAAAGETEDPSTWIWTAADRCLLDLIREVHARGMRIILDGVFNHTGQRFFAFQDLRKNGKASRYRDWYTIERWHKKGTFRHKGWFGFDSLPELARDPTGTTLAEPVRDYIYNITRRWMDPDGDGDPSDGIDGWRLDVAFCVPLDFWRGWRRHVKSINPDAYLTAEICEHAEAWLQGDSFDAVMNYMWLFPTVEFFTARPDPLSATVFRKRLDHLRETYPAGVQPGLMNLLGSHDVGRIVTVLENGSRKLDTWHDYFNGTRVQHDPTVITTRPAAETYAILPQLVIFQMTYPGAPMIYYGDEIGMWGANDPDNRQTMWWEDLPREPETHSLQGLCGPQPREPDAGLMEMIKKAIRLRKEMEELRRGSREWLDFGRDRVLGYDRTGTTGERVRVILNAGDEAAEVSVEVPAVNLWDGGNISCGRLEIPARGFLVLRISALRPQ